MKSVVTRIFPLPWTSSSAASEREAGSIRLQSTVFGPPRVSILAVVLFLTGLSFGVRLDFVGEIYLIEFLLPLIAGYLLVTSRTGSLAFTSGFVGFVATALITLMGYLVSDLTAGTTPEQYLRGWGRTVFLITDSISLMIIALHARSNLCWLALGFSLGGILAPAMDGIPLSEWKRHYGEPFGLLCGAVATFFPTPVAASILLLFGVWSVLLDFRSMGAACVLAGTCLWVRYAMGPGTKFSVRTIVVVGGMASIGVALVMVLLWSTAETYKERRIHSNFARLATIEVTWTAIQDSPWIGYGSWAYDHEYGRKLREKGRELEKILNRPVPTTSSLLPHSQFLQAWVEAGLLGLAFFALYAVRLVRAAWWFGVQRPVDRLTPLAVLLLVTGGWHLVASPFLGPKRMIIALVIGVIAIGMWERKRHARERSRGFASSRNLTPSKSRSQAHGQRPLAGPAHSFDLSGDRRPH